MAYEQKEGDFSLFKNEKKTEDKHPDYTGSIMIGGERKRLSAWIKKGEKGAFFTGQVSDFKPRVSEPVDDPLNPSTAVELGPLEDNSPAPVDTSRKKPPAPVDDGLPF